MRLSLLVLAAAVGAPAGAREVHTGKAVEVEAAPASGYAAVFWVEPRGDDDVEIVGLPAPAAVGEWLDVVDEKGFVARVKVVSLEPATCGKLVYARARARAPWPGIDRALAGAAVALGPSRGRPSRARVLRPEETGEPRAGRMLIDADGDGQPDLARQLSLECSADRGHSAACLETWVRDPGGWRRVARAEIGPCS